jgi:mRNA interferase MazF
VEAPAKGAVVLVRFPFSDLSATKLRPAVVLADAGRGDRVLCQVTSRPYGDAFAVALNETAFTSGSLRVSSYARPGKLFTASSDLMTAQVGALTTEALTEIVDAVVLLLRSGTPSTPKP